jgi:pantothenate kinase
MRQPDLPFPASLQVTEQRIDLSALSDRQKAFYLNLFSDVVALYESRHKPRFVLGIAGPTGAGKSVVAVLLKELSQQAALPFAVEAITMDAYHFPNQYLLSHFSDGQPLKMVKGRFDTYDSAALAADLRDFSAGKTVSFPAYSRKLHDPVQNARTVDAPNVLLIIEGLWLLYDKAGWEIVRPLFDYSIFIAADPARARQPVLNRHIMGGRTLQDAERHYETVDAKNSALVLTTSPRADKIIPPYYALA